MEHVNSAFRDFAAAAAPYLRSAPASRAAVWQPGGWNWTFGAEGGSANSTGRVVELPLFTLAPRWFDYYAYIGVGSPPQYMRVMLDTKGSDLSLLGFDSSGHEVYNHSRSSSYVANNTLVRTELPGSYAVADGVLSQDKITLNQDLALPQRMFTELLDRQDIHGYFDDIRADGWLGLGRSALQRAYSVPSIIGVLLEQNLLREPVVGIHLNPLLTGLVSFGGVNAQRFIGNLSFVEVTPLTGDAITSVETDQFWSFRLDEVLINSKPVEVHLPDSFPSRYYGGSAVLDAVLPFVYGPREIIDAINAELGQDSGLRVPCTSINGVQAVNVTFVFGGTGFSLKREDLVSSVQNGPGCVSLLIPAPPNAPRLADWWIGAPFMQAFYTALDYGNATRPARIGFARSKRFDPPAFSAYDTLWIVLLVVVVVLIMRTIGRKKFRRPSQTKS